jgi:hypothetical protein
MNDVELALVFPGHRVSGQDKDAPIGTKRGNEK